MIPYYVLLATPLVLSLYVKDKKKMRNLMFVILFLFLALRGESVGGDLVNYKHYYIRFSRVSLSACLSYVRWEPGFIVYNKIIATLSRGNFRVFLVTNAFIFSALMSQAIYKISKAPWFSWYALIGLGFLMYPLSGLRASLAMALGVYALSCVVSCEKLNKKVVIKYLILIALAVSFHYTSAIYFLVLPLLYLKKNVFYYAGIVGAAALLFVFSDQIVDFLDKRFYQGIWNDVQANGGGSLLLFIAFFVVVGLVLIRPKDRTPQYSAMLCIMELAFLSQIVTLQFSLWARITEFLYVFIIFFPIELASALEKKLRYIVYGVLMLFVIYMYTTSLITDLCEIVPYVPLWVR